MTDAPRVVRVSADVFDQLDRTFGAERGPNGEPSVHDFLTMDLTRIVAMLGARFDDLPEPYQGRPDYRLLVSTGALVRGFSATAQRRPDASIVLLQLEVDLDPNWD